MASVTEVSDCIKEVACVTDTLVVSVTVSVSSASEALINVGT